MNKKLDSFVDIKKTHEFGKRVDFGKSAENYGKYRQGFPEKYFDLLSEKGLCREGQRALDVGTGTGSVARGLAALGATVDAIDPAKELLAQARILASQVGVTINFSVGKAEELVFDSSSFDLVTAGQCWHWFDRIKAAREIFRVLRPGGLIIISHFDWIPSSGNVVEHTEKLILKYNPAWTMGGGAGLYPQWLQDLTSTNFVELETFSFDSEIPYSHAGWCGRIQASAGVQASLGQEETTNFDKELRSILDKKFPANPLKIPHRCWTTTARKTNT